MERKKKGLLKTPKDDEFSVQIILVDGTIYPQRGKIDFTDPSYNAETGTFLIRAAVDNPDGVLRPNQYVRTELVGAVRTDAILIPQSAVQQSANGHFVWVIDTSNKSQLRPIQVGDWDGDNWFINEGLASGDKVVVDGAIRLAPDTLVSISAASPPQDPASPSRTSTK